MTTVETFKTHIAYWMNKHGFGDLMLGFGEDFAYALFDNNQMGIQIGVIGYPEVSRWFEQFLYEYGLDYSGIYDPVLAFLHEVGHSQTYDYFNDNEKLLYDLSKSFDHGESDMTFLMERYWLIPDEFAANIWEINFINNHIDAVEELCWIYANDWTAMVEEIDVMTLVQEVA